MNKINLDLDFARKYYQEKTGKKISRQFIMDKLSEMGEDITLNTYQNWKTGDKNGTPQAVRVAKLVSIITGCPMDKMTVIR